MIDQAKVLANVLMEIEDYTFTKDLLVKPLDPVMVTKTFTRPIPVLNEDGTQVIEGDVAKYDTEEVTEEVESPFAKGIVLALPSTMDTGIKVGDTIIYPSKFAIPFDHYRDSVFVKPYDVVARIPQI